MSEILSNKTGKVALESHHNLIEKISLRILNKIAKVIHPSSLRIFIHRLRGVEIGKGVFIGSNVDLDDYNPKLITLSDGVRISKNTVVLVHKRNIGEYYEKGMLAVDVPMKEESVVFKKNVQVGVGSIIMPGVVVGEQSIIGAGSLVVKSVPDNSVVVGNPAKVIREY